MENLLEPKEAFNLFKVPMHLESIVTALMVSIISKNKKRQSEALESAEYFALDLDLNDLEIAKSKVLLILNHIRKINGLAPMGDFKK